MGGHFISALLGVCITKLFLLLPSQERFDQLRWLDASLSTAVALVVMDITKTTHPPAGATALLPAIQDDIRELGWYYLPVILLMSTLVLVTALLINNIQRKYPVFWIGPENPVNTRPEKNPSTTKAEADIGSEDRTSSERGSEIV
jgi:CBS-domain-containing membrane protein